VDPIYPVLRTLAQDLGLSVEERLRLVFCHVAYYHLGSALAFFEGRGPTLPCATERRGHRDPKKLAAHLEALRAISEAPGGWSLWLEPSVAGKSPREAWKALNERLTEIYGNGRWAAYKTAEMLWKICGLPVEAADMGHLYSTGPRKGLNLLFDDLPQGSNRDEIAALDKASEKLCRLLKGEGLKAPIEETETTLCDFHSLCGGNYYIGHDIDQMLRQLLDVQSGLTHPAIRARRSLPRAYRGEVNGWSGPDKLRKGAYLRTGRILERT
jgi:hypothetical protein